MRRGLGILFSLFLLTLSVSTEATPGVLFEGSVIAESKLAMDEEPDSSIVLMQTNTGNLIVSYQPLDAEVWLDGEKLGNSPDIFHNIIVGSHLLELRMDGFLSNTLTINVEEGKTVQVFGKLTMKYRPKTAILMPRYTVPESPVYEIVEHMPTFPGGDAALIEFLSRNVKYPPVASDNDIQGKVVCKFTVETDGTLTNIRVTKAVAPLLDREAVRVIKSMPKWNPGKQDGKAVRVQYSVPVTFRPK